MSAVDAEAFIRDKLSVSVPWSDLVQQSNLQKILLAIVQRLDRYDHTLAAGAGGSGSSGSAGKAGLTVVPSEELQAYRDRIEALENVVLQTRVEGLGAVASEAKRRLELSKHVIPLMQLKAKVDSFEATLMATADQVDETNERMAAMATAFEKSIGGVRDDLKSLEQKHEALAKRVEELARDLFEQIKKKMAEMQEKIDKMQGQVDKLNARADETDARVTRCFDYVDQVDNKVDSVGRRVLAVEELMPNKADREELERAIKEIKEEIAKMNIEEVMAMARKANERIDLMDVRCDRMEDEAVELKKFVHQFVKELEDQQLEKQIETLRRELQEAKTGVLSKANERMDAIQREAEEMKAGLASTQGHVQVTRENVQQLEEFVREKIGVGVDFNSSVPSAVPPGSSKALLAQLQQDVGALQERFAQIAEGNNDSKQKRALETIDEIMARLEVLDASKADRETLRVALDEKADKDLVARETEANQRAVDEALRTMNAGTHGIQQLLEKQEGAVSLLFDKVAAKSDREDLERLEEELRRARAAPDPHAALEDLYTKYGVSADEAAAAGMRRPMQKYNCISCNRPVQPEYRDAMPSLPLLPPTKDRTVPYIANGTRKNLPNITQPQGWNESLVEVRELPPNLRSAGGSYTSPRVPAPPLRRPGARSPEADQLLGVRRDSGSKLVDLVGEDGKIYHGRMRSAGTLRLSTGGGGSK